MEWNPYFSPPPTAGIPLFQGPQYMAPLQTPIYSPPQQFGFPATPFPTPNMYGPQGHMPRLAPETLDNLAKLKHGDLKYGLEQMYGRDYVEYLTNVQLENLLDRIDWDELHNAVKMRYHKPETSLSEIIEDAIKQVESNYACNLDEFVTKALDTLEKMIAQPDSPVQPSDLAPSIRQCYCGIALQFHVGDLEPQTKKIKPEGLTANTLDRVVLVFFRMFSDTRTDSRVRQDVAYVLFNRLMNCDLKFANIVYHPSAPVGEKLDRSGLIYFIRKEFGPLVTAREISQFVEHCSRMCGSSPTGMRPIVNKIVDKVFRKRNK
ncbi:hypothetical protein TRVA0_019S00232 [Trichomonascus vanleenenianus]|uniref:uncharacterized protein n=1 Tax=Trichomonascus vanleenenianus TaxID=2268995 RepID=UPI003EC999F5